MKKFIILLFGLSMAFGASAQYHDWSKWSVTLEAGINRFDGDIQQAYNSLIPTSFGKVTLGGSVEYVVFPTLSIGMDYYYVPLAAKKVAKNDPNFIIADFTGKMNNVSLFGSLNLIKAFNPASTSRWGIWANAGLGFAWYKSLYYTDRAGETLRDGHGNLYTDFNDTINDGRAMFYPITLLVEYNISKSIALGIKGHVRGYNKDYIEQRIQHGVTNDYVEMLTLQLRYKFKAKDDRQHTRNPVEIEETATKSELDRLQDQINAIVIPGPDPRIDDLDRRLKKLEDILCPDGPDTDGDGVPDCRDLEPDTPEGNQVDFWGRTIPKGTTYEPEAFIYFDFDRTNLDEEAHKAIRIAAGKLQADPSLIVEVRGFTDNMGSIPYNADLSQRRAEVVKAELVKQYGIDADRIIANGKGKFNPEDKVIPYRPYRTAAFFYSK